MLKKSIFCATVVSLVCFCASLSLGAEILQPSLDDITPADRGVPPVRVEKEGLNWIIAGKRNVVVLNGDDLSLTVKSGSAEWRMMPSSAGDLTVSLDTGRVELRLADAGEIEITPYETGFKTGVKITLRKYNPRGKNLDLELQLFLTLETPEDELVCEIAALEKENKVKELVWPRGFVPGSADYTVVPYRQGILVPGDWPEKISFRWMLTHTVSLYMPWWGLLKGEDAAFVLLETPDDAGCRFEHPAGGPTTIEPRWIHSLGSLKYTRKLRICFLESAGYVELAKRYRRHVIETGHFVSLREKIARTPLLSKLIGSPVAHFGITSHTQPESRYYHKENPERNHRVTTFGQRAESLRELHRKGIKKLYVHLDGWGYRGYDNLHPEYLPPSPEGGKG